MLINIFRLHTELSRGQQTEPQQGSSSVQSNMTLGMHTIKKISLYLNCEVIYFLLGSQQ